MAYTETTTTGYGTRVGNSFKAIGSGFLLFIAGTALLWWNEGRAVKTEKMLEEAGSAYVEMENPNKKDASLEGELICGTALATTEDSLTDAQFGIGAKAISLRRTVEYYQWVEHATEKKEDKLGGKEVTTTTYTYSKEWVSRPIESASFKDPAYQKKNMVLATFENDEQWAENVSWGVSDDTQIQTAYTDDSGFTQLRNYYYFGEWLDENYDSLAAADAVVGPGVGFWFLIGDATETFTEVSPLAE